MTNSLEGCVFCEIVSGMRTPEVVSYRDSDTIVFPSLHQRPQNRGHTLVIPTKHIQYVYDVDRQIGGNLIETVAAVARAVRKIWSADGVSVRQNNEKHGGQDVFHVHFHVVPRYANDNWYDGEDRFPYGLVEVTYEERVDQAAKLRAELQNIGTLQTTAT